MARVFVYKWARIGVALLMVGLGAYVSYQVTAPATVKVAGIEASASFETGSGSIEVVSGRGISTELASAALGLHLTLDVPPQTTQEQLLADINQANQHIWPAICWYFGRLAITGVGVVMALWLPFAWWLRRRKQDSVKRWRQAGVAAGLALTTVLVQAGVAAASVHAANIADFKSRSCSGRSVEFVTSNIDSLTPPAPAKVVLPYELLSVNNPQDVLAEQISDDHLNPQGLKFALAVQKAVGGVSFTLDNGDLLSYGQKGEQCLVLPLVRKLGRYLWVKGNHDPPWFVPIMKSLPNVTVLDGTTTTVEGITVYGKGDPACTPCRDLGTDALRQKVHSVMPQIMRDLAQRDVMPDAVMVHDQDMVQNRPAGAGDLSGLVPLVLYGHHHVPGEQTVYGTTYLEAGTVGADGLQLGNLAHHPFSLNLLYFNRLTHRLDKYCVVQSPGGSAGISADCQILASPAALAKPARD